MAAAAFQYSENSAFSPVPFEVYDYSPMNSNSIDTLSPNAVFTDYDTRHNQTPIDHWVNVHQQTNSYDSPTSIPYGFFTYPYIQECLAEPGFIRKRNERERMRVRNVNEGYAQLRDHLPLEPTEKRLSKVETLRGAIKYIKLLQSVLQETKPGKESSKRHSASRNVHHDGFEN